MTEKHGWAIARITTVTHVVYYIAAVVAHGHIIVHITTSAACALCLAIEFFIDRKINHEKDRHRKHNSKNASAQRR